MQLVLIAGFSLLGMTQFALSQDRHWQAVLGRGGATAQGVRRFVAALLLLGSLGVAIWRDGPAFGFLLWFLMVQCAAFGVTGALAFSPRTLRFLAGG